MSQLSDNFLNEIFEIFYSNKNKWPQLPADCLSEIFEYLEENKVALHSCLLVNRLWFEVAVRILWRRIWNYDNFITLMSCLPSESKKILRENGINIITPTSKPPMFNYAAFCKDLSINRVDDIIDQLFKKKKPYTSPLNLDNNKYIIYKLLMKQITSLNKLSIEFSNRDFTIYPEATDYLNSLSELECSSNIRPGFFCQLSQICHNLQSLSIRLGVIISYGLADLISVQKGLKNLKIIQQHSNHLTDVIPSLITKIPNTITSLKLDGSRFPLSFIAKFTNLQELWITFYNIYTFKDFKNLHDVKFSQLHTLKIENKSSCPKYELLIKFLENNGKNLKEFYIDDYDPSGVNDNDLLNLSIAKFCQNLRKLSTGFKNDELETLKIIFNSCQHLESIKIWCGGVFLNEKEPLEIIAEYSPKNVYELKLIYLYNLRSELLPEELETFLISWANRRPQKSLSLIIVNSDANSLDTNVYNRKIIEKYIKLGFIKLQQIPMKKINY